MKVNVFCYTWHGKPQAQRYMKHCIIKRDQNLIKNGRISPDDCRPVEFKISASAGTFPLPVSEWETSDIQGILITAGGCDNEKYPDPSFGAIAPFLNSVAIAETVRICAQTHYPSEMVGIKGQAFRCETSGGDVTGFLYAINGEDATESINRNYVLPNPYSPNPVLGHWLADNRIAFAHEARLFVLEIGELERVETDSGGPQLA